MVGIFEKAGAANAKGHANEVVRALGWIKSEDQDKVKRSSGAEISD